MSSAFPILYLMIQMIFSLKIKIEISKTKEKSLTLQLLQFEFLIIFRIEEKEKYDEKDEIIMKNNKRLLSIFTDTLLSLGILVMIISIILYNLSIRHCKSKKVF